MKKSLLFFAMLALALTFAGCEEPESEIDVLTKIPDPAFLAYCRNSMDKAQELYFLGEGKLRHPAWDTDGDGRLSLAEAANVEAMEFIGYDKEESDQVASLEGIEYFTELRLLKCDYNRLTELDMSGFTTLQELDCNKNSDYDNNRLHVLDISGCTSLTKLYCIDNALGSLDISDCTALTSLHCYNNPGDMISKFPVRAWFDNNSIPVDLDMLISWDTFFNYPYGTITIDFQKVD